MTEKKDSVRKLVEAFIQDKGISYVEAAKYVGKNRAYIQQFVNNGVPKRLPEDVREKLAELFQVDESVLKPNSLKSEGSTVKAARQEMTDRTDSHSDVPVYDIEASAGDGAHVVDGPPIYYQSFRDQLLSRLTRAPLEQLAVIMVSGDSMEPTLRTGDHVLVDRTVREVKKDGIYILLLEGELLIKRCQRNLSDGSVIVLSDNPRYREQVVDQPDVLQIVGRAIYKSGTI